MIIPDAVVGPMGGGKSSLLKVLLGEVSPSEGSVSYSGMATGTSPNIAYVPQQPFSFEASIRDNIALGRDDIKVESVVALAQMKADLKKMPYGLGTYVQEGGSNLSGGQKQRINLARAAASNAGIVILDTPFSSVDHDMEDKLTRALIFGHWQHKTRVVSANRLRNLDQFDRIVFIDMGAL